MAESSLEVFLFVWKAREGRQQEQQQEQQQSESDECRSTGCTKYVLTVAAMDFPPPKLKTNLDVPWIYVAPDRKVERSVRVPG